MLLPVDPMSGQPVPWLVRTHVLGLLPHALAGPEVRPVLDVRDGWVRLTAADVDVTGLPLAGTAMISRYGPSVVESHAGSTVPAQQTLEGDQATAAGLRAAAATADLLELTVPAAGGGRLGGVLFSPVGGDVALAEWGDEALGFVPWHRFATIDLPPLVVLDHSRFDPGDHDFGPAYAATALMRSADAVLMTRWPMADDPRAVVMDRVAAGIRSGIPFPVALTAAQRLYLDQSEALGDARAGHPRAWAGWLLFAAP
jgi:hypothetical protein